jgi:hypothetical protein
MYTCQWGRKGRRCTSQSGNLFSQLLEQTAVRTLLNPDVLHGHPLWTSPFYNQTAATQALEKSYRNTHSFSKQHQLLYIESLF